jgi:TolB protein
MNVWRQELDGESGARRGEPQPVTMPSGRIRCLAFSRDGRHLVYAEAVSRTNIRRLTLDADLRVQAEPVGITQGARITTNPALSPDRQWLVFDSLGEKQEDLFIAASDGAGERRLTDDEYRDRGARWSPDGRRIAFLSDRSGRFEIWAINPDGSGLRQLTDTTGAYAQQPVWSPDGRRIAFSRTVAPVALIEVDAPDGSRGLASLRPFNSPEQFFARSWSADGRLLAGNRAFDRPDSGVIVYTFDSEMYEVLTESGRRPTWLDDNRRLVYLEAAKLMLVDRETKHTRVLLDFAPNGIDAVAMTGDGRQMYVAVVSNEADIWMATLQ